MAGFVDEIAEELVDRIVVDGGGEVMSMLARPTPLGVMTRWLGLDLPEEATAWADAPATDWRCLAAAGRARFTFVRIDVTGRTPPAVRARSPGRSTVAQPG
jgi:cytochrome P450